MEPQITNNKPEKMKNPKRVEQGKKLSLISKEAKAKKKIERESIQNEELTNFASEYTSTGPLCVVGLVGVGAVLTYFWYQKKPLSSLDVKSEKSERSDQAQRGEQQEPKTFNKTKNTPNMLETLD